MKNKCPEIWGVRTFVIEDTLRAQALKVLEEAAELVEAVKAFERIVEKEDTYPFVREWAYEKAASELADVLQSTLNTAAAMGFVEETVNRAMDQCHERNRERGRVE